MPEKNNSKEEIRVGKDKGKGHLPKDFPGTHGDDVSLEVIRKKEKTNQRERIAEKEFCSSRDIHHPNPPPPKGPRMV